MRNTIMAAAVAATMASAPAVAQNADGLVTVQVTDVEILKNSLNNNDVDVLNNLLNNNQLEVGVNTPVNLQVPIGIAANVCGTTVLALQDDPDNTSQSAVRRQLAFYRNEARSGSSGPRLSCRFER